jgi:pimeloyl-ACP methyl ester carboxylesterase
VLISTARPGAPWRARHAGDDYGVTATPSWREVDWRAHLHQVDLDGDEVNYVDIGPREGRPVVFVHGLGGQWQNFLQNIPRAALERRVVALDLPGFGCSPMPRERISISAYAAHVERLCERLALGPIDLVGNSMGGFISAELSIRHPERVERLVLVSAAGISNVSAARAPTMTLGRVATALTVNSIPVQRRTASRPGARAAALALVVRYPGRLAADLAYEGLISGTGKPGFLDALGASLEYDFRDRLPGIGAPTLIVWGEDDMILPAKDAAEYERLIPDSRRVMMADTGHVPMVERPETFNDLMMEFLAESGSAEGAGEAEAEAKAEEAA